MASYEETVNRLNAQIRINGHIIGAAVGNGMMAKYVVSGGADLLLALSAGRHRMAGMGSLGSYFCYGNGNEIVKTFVTQEILPLVKDVRVLFGLFAQAGAFKAIEK